MKKLVLVLVASVWVSGCATSQQQIDSHAPAMSSWMGAPIDEFLAVQGAPTTVVQEAEYRVFRFDASKTKHVGISTGSCQPTNFNEPIDEYGRPASCSSGERPWYSVTYACTYELVVTGEVITDWRMNGNNCKMVTVHERPLSAETG